MDKYQLYQINLKNLILNYKLEYYWLNIEDQNFYGNSKISYSHFEYKKTVDPWLNKYQNNCIELAKDILVNGMYTPFFYYELNGKNYLFLGKHRFYSLKLFNEFNKNNKIQQKFLFIKIPNFSNKNLIFPNKDFYYFDTYSNKEIFIVKYYNDINKLLQITGDALTQFLWNNKFILPFKPFNYEKEFNTWLYSKE